MKQKDYLSPQTLATLGRPYTVEEEWEEEDVVPQSILNMLNIWSCFIQIGLLDSSFEKDLGYFFIVIIA